MITLADFVVIADYADIVDDVSKAVLANTIVCCQ